MTGAGCDSRLDAARCSRPPVHQTRRRTAIEVLYIAIMGILSLSLSLPARAQEVQDVEAPKACALGYCMGDNVDLEEEGDDFGVSYATVTHPAFDKLSVYWTAHQGVCQLSGFDFISNPDDYGRAHRTKFDHFRDLVARKHGEPSVYFDILLPSSTWKEPTQWLMGLQKGHRQMVALWVKGARYEEASQRLKSIQAHTTEGRLSPDLIEADAGTELSTEGLAEISIAAQGAFIIVTYQFDNHAQCIEEGKAKIGVDF